jgi:hypothetical protein
MPGPQPCATWMTSGEAAGWPSGANGRAWADMVVRDVVIRPRPRANAEAASNFMAISFLFNLPWCGATDLRKKYGKAITQRHGIARGFVFAELCFGVQHEAVYQRRQRRCQWWRCQPQCRRCQPQWRRCQCRCQWWPQRTCSGLRRSTSFCDTTAGSAASLREGTRPCTGETGDNGAAFAAAANAAVPAAIPKAIFRKWRRSMTSSSFVQSLSE